MSRESINKQLRAWAQAKWVRLERGGVVVLRPEALLSIIQREGRTGVGLGTQPQGQIAVPSSPRSVRRPQH